MSKEQLDQEIVSTSMEIILNAGDARLCINEAYQAIAALDVLKAKAKVKEAEEKMLLAHASQTDLVQKECQGDPVPYSVLFSHAQDTCMTINSELVTAKKLIPIYEMLFEKIEKLEKAVFE